jgi:hypothetical protein
MCEIKFKSLLPLAFFLIVVLNINMECYSQEPQKVYRYCYTQGSKEWYEKQAELWKAELNENSENSDSWYYYFFATRYATLGMAEDEREQLLNSIIDEIGTAIPDSYLYYYLKYYNGDRQVEYLEKALKINPGCADLYWDFIQYYELNGMKPLMKIYCEKLYSSEAIITTLYDYNFNVLNSTESNSILFTNGDNDNYPAWVLQEAKGIRKDVTILNAHTVYVLRDYLRLKLNQMNLDINIDELPEESNSTFLKGLISAIKSKYPDIPIHIALTVYEDYYKEIKDKLYLTGLVYTYSETSFDNVSVIKKMLEQNFRLDHLNYDWYNEKHVSQKMMHRYNTNYIPSFLEVAKEYYLTGNSELAVYWKNKALHLAEQANDESRLQEIENLEF